MTWANLYPGVHYGPGQFIHPQAIIYPGHKLTQTMIYPDYKLAKAIVLYSGII